MPTASITNTFLNAATILASEHNQNFTDLVDFLNTHVVHLDGSKTMTANLNMGSNKIVSVTDPTAAQDAATKAYVDSLALAEVVEDVAGAMFTGNTETFITATYQDADGTVDLVVPVLDEDDMVSDSATDLATQQSIKAYADLMLPLAGGTMSGAIAMGTSKITGLGDPSAAQDAVTLNHFDTNYTAADVLTKLLTVDGAGTLLDADLLDAREAIAFAWGRLGFGTASATQSSIGSGITDLTSLSAAVTVGASRLIKITVRVWNINRTGTTADGDQFEVLIREGATELGAFLFEAVDDTTANFGSCAASAVVVAPTSGAHTYKASFNNLAGSATYAVQYDGTNPNFLLVEDIGPSS